MYPQFLFILGEKGGLMQLKDFQFQNLHAVLDQVFHLLLDPDISYNNLSIQELADLLEKPEAEVQKKLEEQRLFAVGIEITEEEICKITKKIIWIDVRQSWEWEQASLPESLWLWEESLKSKMHSWEEQGHVMILVSDLGQRSWVAAMSWRSEGVQVFSLKKGLKQEPWLSKLTANQFV